jgi:hypothetical protein
MYEIQKLSNINCNISYHCENPLELDTINLVSKTVCFSAFMFVFERRYFAFV